MASRDSLVDQFYSEDGSAPGPGPADWALFVLRSALRRRLVAVAVFLVLADLLVVYYRLKSPEYRVETRILAQRQTALPSIARSYVQEDAPTRDSSDLIHRRENLLDLISHAGLLEARGRPPARGGFLDRIALAASRLADPPSSSDDPRDRLAVVLDRRLKVSVEGGTITIQIDWPDPQQAYRLVEGALQNFLEARHVQEVTTLDETISLLQARGAALREELAKAVEEARRGAVQEARSTSRAPVPALGATTLPALPSEELVRLRSMLEAKERAIRDVEEFRRRRLADLQAQHDARKAVYAESHPEMETLRQDIAALSRDSPQISALRDEERTLRRELETRLAQEGRRGSPAAAPATADLPRALEQDVNARVERNERVRDARLRYEQMLGRVSAAQLELATARAAFKYRYAVIWPPEIPTRPVSPKPLVVFGLGGLASLVLAFLAAAAVDWRSGRVVERWQAERGLDLPVIGELRRR